MRYIVRPLALIIVLLVTFELSAFEAPKASIEWDETTIDMGELKMNEAVKVEFLFNNPGMIPLLVSDVKPSCGCTVADFPKKPILSGSQEKIIVTYDAKTEGYFSKTISVFTNTSGGLTKLYIKGFVIK